MEPQRLLLERLALCLMERRMNHRNAIYLAIGTAAALIITTYAVAQTTSTASSTTASATVAVSAMPPVAAPAVTPFPAPPHSRLTPEQEKQGWNATVSSCLVCHSADMLAQQRLTQKQWQASVDKMEKWGAVMHPEAKASLVAYLSDRFTTATPPYKIPTITADAAAAQLAPQPDGKFASSDITGGQEFYVEHCASCHADNARGEIGNNLVDRPILYRAEEFATIVKEGKGRMLAFRDTLTDEQIGAMIAYLRTLPNNPVKTDDLLSTQTEPAGN